MIDIIVPFVRSCLLFVTLAVSVAENIFALQMLSRVEISKHDLPRDSFSPESGGSVKPRTAMDAMSTQGTIRLKK